MSSKPGHSHKPTSSLEDFTFLELNTDVKDSLGLHELDVTKSEKIPKSTLIVVTETEKLQEAAANMSPSTVQSMADFDFDQMKIKVTDWDGTKFYSDYIKEGREFKGEDTNVIMIFESPSSVDDNTFHNASKYKFHDWPPPKSTKAIGIIGPTRYAAMNGDALPVFLRNGAPPDLLLAHWKEVLPEVPAPRAVTKVTTEDTIYAYLPIEQVEKHVNDPIVHYHLAGKDSIVLMTQKTTKLLPDTRTVRPCVVKTTHSMASRGIFVIKNDEDNAEFEQYLKDSGNPTFVVTDFVDIARNVACHFYMHPDGENVTWIGSNENYMLPNGKYSSDSYLRMGEYESLKKMQLPFVEEVVLYCRSLGFWGFTGVDVLFDSKGRGYLVDINPRVTGSCPALMTLTLLNKKYGFQVALFRRHGDKHFYGSAVELFEQVSAYNKEHEGKSKVVIFSMYEPEDPEYPHVSINIGVYGNDMDECKTVLNSFAKPKKFLSDGRSR